MTSTNVGSRGVPGLEIWLIGTPAELDTAARALAGIGRVVSHSSREPLTSGDGGRWRTYARLTVTPVHTTVTAPGASGEPDAPPLDVAA